MPFLDSLDIANRALQHVGQPPIASVTEDTKANLETSFAFDKTRRAELRRNNWRFATRKAVLRAVDTDTMLLVPAAWDDTVTYFPGAIVADTNGQAWLSMREDNTANEPGGSNNYWEMYYGPLTIYPYDSTTTYWTGELVYAAGANPGSYFIYQSLQSSNADVPGTATVWDSTVTYHGDDVISYSGDQWRSLIEFNLNITPAVGPTDWAIGATYASGNTATGSDHFIYTSQANGNVGHDPTTDDGTYWVNSGTANAWADAPTIPVSSQNWRVIAATMRNLKFSYPIGTGPASDTDSRNVFRLPSGFLKVAPQDPKEGSVTALGGPSGRIYEDWNFEGDYITSSDTGPLLFRFVADITRVSSMDDMFCEGFALTIAMAICEPLTQDMAKLQALASEYKLRMGEARAVNAIEIGPIEPPEDEWVTVRY